MITVCLVESNMRRDFIKEVCHAHSVEWTVTDSTRIPVSRLFRGILQDLEYVMLIMQLTCAMEN